MGLDADKLGDELLSSVGRIDAGGGKTIREIITGDSLTDFLNAIASTVVRHIQTNGVVSFSSGKITGTCPSGGGSLTAGAGSGGKIE